MEADLLAAIAPAPDDDGPRLVYADWLEERADPRGELIQVQCALASLDQGDARFSPLKRREAALWQKHQAAWHAPLSPLAHESFSFRRGMIEVASIKSDRLASVRSAAPTLRELMISCEGPADELEVASSPLLAGITALGLTSARGIGADAVNAVLTSAHLRKLQRLRLTLGVDSAMALGATAKGHAPEGLRSLVLTRGSDTLDPAWISRLASSEIAAGLTRLRLFGMGLGPEGARAIAGSARLAGLEELHIDTDYLKEGFLALFGSPHLSGLRRLRLSRAGYVSPEAIARCQWLKRLTSLRLTDGWQAAGAVFATPETFPGVVVDPIEQLDELDLSGNDLGDKNIRALARWPPLARVTRLNLAHNRISAGAACDLMASPHLGLLTELMLHQNSIGDEGADALAATDRLSRLTSLTLNKSLIGARGAKAIASSPHLGRLTRLTLFDNMLGEEGATALAASPYLDPVELSVGSEVGKTGIARLKERFGAALSVGP
jgi:uncharacterized protein (TIGR02996 family)